MSALPPKGDIDAQRHFKLLTEMEMVWWDFFRKKANQNQNHFAEGAQGHSRSQPVGDRSADLSLDHTDFFANAFRTSDCEIPNCRAIREGVTPALNAARTAFNFPCVNGTAAASTFLLRGLSSEAGSFLPRRFSSASTAASNRSSSWSLRCLTALARSLGKICRDEVFVAHA